MSEQASFDVRKCVEQFKAQKTNVVVTRPVQLTCWTKETGPEGPTFRFGDDSGLATLELPTPPQDLAAGFPDRYKPKGNDPSPVDTIVSAALHARPQLPNAHVVTYRNNLNKLLLTPLQRDKEWAINACCFQGKLFLDITGVGYTTFKDQDRFNYYGYHFESICAGNAAGSALVDPSSEFAVVVLVQIGQHRVMMAAEVDSHDPGSAEAGPEQGKPYVELKTYTIPAHPGAVARLYSDKHPTWWVQSYLAGVGDLILGGRDRDGVLRKVHRVAVGQLPELSAAAGKPWDTQLLLGFGEAALSWMVEQAAAAEGTTFCFRYDPKQQAIVCTAAAAEEDMQPRLAALLGS